jgi:ribonuclease VapC
MKYVADASAVIAYLDEEPYSFDLDQIIPGATISAVNLSEVVDKYARDGNSREEIEDMLTELALYVIPLDESLAFDAGLLRPITDRHGISLGDRCCMALAMRLDCVVVTSDRSWKNLQEQTGLVVQLIR